MNKSIWEASSEYLKHYEALNGNHQAEVLVIGGGITGISTAFLLAEAGKKVILLEAGLIGLGTTGNSTGNLYMTVAEHLSGLKKKWGVETMKKVVASRSAAIELIENKIKQFAINCSFQRASFNYYAEKKDEKSTEFFREEMEAMHEAGLAAAIVNDPRLPFPAEQCLTLQNQAQFHPLDYVRGLADHMPASCRIFENSAVTGIDDDGTVKVKGGSVKADMIVMATHTPKGVYMVQSFLGPYREHGVAAELKEGDFPPGIYWSYHNPKRSLRILEKAGKKYMMIVGDKYKTGHGGNTNEYVNELESFLGTTFSLGEERYYWGGQQYRPADSLPYIGKHSDGLYMATGFSTDGLVYGTLAAQIISAEILGNTSPWADLYKFHRFTPIKSFKEFFSENAENLLEYFKDMPWTAKDEEDISNGKAAIVEHDGRKLGVYKDEAGNRHVVSAVCTHMKCIVNWNPAEKSWDCPCHGSRFNYDGKVIEGPAVVDLPKQSIKS